MSEKTADWVAVVERDGVSGVIDVDGGVVIPLEYEKVFVTGAGLALTRKDKKFGFVDRAGDPVGPPGLDNAASRFRDELAVVKQHGRFGYIDVRGEVVIPAAYAKASSFSEGLARVSKNGKTFGYIDTAGKAVIKPQFTADARSFKEGMAAVKKRRKWGFVDASGDVAVPCEFDEVGDFSGGLARVQRRAGRRFEYGFVDKQGSLLGDEWFASATEVKGGLARVSRAASSSSGAAGVRGFIDATGAMVLDFGLLDLLNVDPFSEGLAAADRGSSGNRRGYVDRTGEMVIDERYFVARPFAGGHACVAVAESLHAPYLFTYIDTEGEAICAPAFQYEWKARAARLRPRDFSEGIVAVREDEKWGHIDARGTRLGDIRYDMAWDFFGGRALVRLDGACGFVDVRGELAIPADLGSASNFQRWSAS